MNYNKYVLDIKNYNKFFFKIHTSSSVNSPALLVVSMSALRKQTNENLLPTPLIDVKANGTFILPSMFVFKTRRMC
jgi:hypothetical protein